MLINLIVDKNIIFPSALEWLNVNGILLDRDVSSAFLKGLDLHLSIECNDTPNFLNQYIRCNNPDFYITHITDSGFGLLPMVENEEIDKVVTGLFIPFNNIASIYKFDELSL